MIPSNFRIEILEIRTLLCALGTKGLNNIYVQKNLNNPSCYRTLILFEVNKDRRIRTKNMNKKKRIKKIYE